jgi:hypothetical protein
MTIFRVPIEDPDSGARIFIKVEGQHNDPNDDRLFGQVKFGGTWLHVELCRVEWVKRGKRKEQLGRTPLDRSRLAALETEFDVFEWSTCELKLGDETFEYVAILTNHAR